MRIFTLSLLAACATAAFAQSPYGVINDQNDTYLKGRQTMNVGKVASKTVQGPRGMAKAPALEELTAMFDQPEGELMLMRRSGSDWMPAWGSPAPAYNEEKGTWVVKGTDGCYYFKNFVTNMCNGGAWVKGTVEGDIISVATGQICTQLWYDNGETNQIYTYYLFALDYDTHTEIDPWYGTEYEVKDFFPVFDIESIQFQIQEDGSITCLDEELLFGGVEEEEGAYTWPGYGDQGSCFYPFDEVAQTAPEGIEYTQYLMKYNSFGEDSYRFVNAAVVNDSLIYIPGLAEILPSGVVIAEIEGDSALVKNDQFMGVDEKYSTLVYLKTATSRVEVDEWGWSTVYFDPIEGFSFAYDAETQNFGTETSALLINAGKMEIIHHDQFDRPSFTVWNEVPAVPAQVEWTQFNPYTEYDWGAWGFGSFNLESLDVDGNYILPEKLYYICYFDETPVTFVNATTGEDMVEVDYFYNDNDLVGGGSKYHTIYYYSGDFEHMGVQSVYYGGGERHCSPIVYEDGTVGIETTEAPAAVATRIVDAAGNVRSALAPGINIVTITYANGKSKTAKVMIK